VEQNPQKAPDLFLDMVDSDYDPLADPEADGADLDESDGQQGPHTDYQATAFYVSAPDDRSAAQRIEDLFAAMATRRRVLLDILEFLDAPQRSDALQQKVEKLQEYNASVYSGYNLSLLLEEAGAIQKVSEDGSQFDEETEQLPDVVEVDGLPFFKPTDGKQVFWLITAEGRAYLEADDPFGRLAELIAEEPQYQAIYKNLLEFCDNEAGRGVEELAALIDDDPLVQKPRRYFSYFVKKLEDGNALVWTKKWHTTASGKRGLELLFSEPGEAAPEEAAPDEAASEDERQGLRGGE
jgi:hypothetical protein